MRRKTFFILAFILLVAGGVYAKYFRNAGEKETLIRPAAPLEEKIQEPSPLPLAEKNSVPPEDKSDSLFQPPLSRAGERTTKKKFGTFITPQTSPVQPEKFRGYHTGTDFEIFPGEENEDVPVKAVCSGKLLTKKSATGYGGVAVESCDLNDEPITVVYGHLKLTSINFNVGDKINAGDPLGILGRGYSSETSGERKHLHLGFHKGTAVNILGYVQNKLELAGWLDSCQSVCN